MKIFITLEPLMIDMKLGPVTKLDKRNTAMPKNLEQSRRWILNPWSVKPTFSLITTFCLTITENRTKRKKKSNTAFILLL